MPQANKQQTEMLRAAMNYRAWAKTCGTCRHFVGDDCSGSLHARSAHCTANKLQIDVRPEGCCDHHEDKKPH